MLAIKRWAAALAAMFCLHAQADDAEFRKALAAEMEGAYDSQMTFLIERRYAAALANSERTPAGAYVADVIRRHLPLRPKGTLDVPGRDDFYIPLERNMQVWGNRFPQSSLAAVLQAQVYMNHGWEWRGGGWSNTVSAEGQKNFELYVARAYDALMQREEVGRKDPYWYVEMLEVARNQGWDRDSYMKLVREATQAFPSNHQVYAAIASRLTPRWGGSAQEVARLAAYAVDQSRDTDGESLYARIYWSVSEWLDADFSGPDVDWPRIRAGFEDIVKRYPDVRNYNFYARFACDARDAETARRLLLRIKSDVVADAWSGRPHYLRCVDAVGLKRDELR